MRLLLFGLLGLLSLELRAQPATTNANINFIWDWALPANLGGLSTNDYLTNIVFQLYSAPAVNGPWTAVGTYSAAPSYLGTNTFGASFPNTNQLQFFELTTSTAGGESPPSNRLPILPVGQAGILRARR